MRVVIMGTVTKIVAVFACMLTLMMISITCGFLLMRNVHDAIMESKPDTSQWVLQNEEYEIVPEFEERQVRFHIVEKESGKTVFSTDEGGWRAWDFKRLDIRKNNDIVIITGDMGEQILRFGNGKWTLEN